MIAIAIASYSYQALHDPEINQGGWLAYRF